mmetsp:Transcript_44612/g.100747  ORF Transcript_44612/g.100747 Transcript_44612/m.100747 type:complete len:227 (-) Transcript_44612:116-796(-)
MFPTKRADTTVCDPEVRAAIDGKNLELLREIFERQGAGSDGALDYALAQVDSRFVHLSLAYSSTGLDIRRAYSAVDRLANPQPFRLMETYKMPPLAQFILAGFWETPVLCSYLETRHLISQCDVHTAVIQATEVLERDAEALFRSRALDFSRLRSITCSLRDFAAEILEPWDTIRHGLFPRAFRDAVECCVGISSRWSPVKESLPLVLWGHVFACVDRNGFEPQSP